MKDKQLNARRLRERGMLLRAPMVVVPLMTILFWALGGGKVRAGKGVPILAKGLNMLVPPPKLPRNMPGDKFAMYEQAARDSAARVQRERMERMYAEKMGLDVPEDTANGEATPPVKPDLLIRKAKERVSELERVIASSPVIRSDRREYPRVSPQTAAASPDLSKLERVMGMLRDKETGTDPEVQEINTMLDKLTALQMPRKDSGRSAVKDTRKLADIHVIAEDGDTSTSLEIEALIPEEQVLAGGAQVRLELMVRLQIAGQVIPGGTLLYGVSSLSGERLRVTITSIRCGGHDWPVRLEVFDQDGMEGIYIPGAPMSDALRESTGQDVGSLEPGALSNTVAGQATGAGIQMARSMVTRKLRIVRVTVPGGYQVYLKSQSQ